VKVAVPAAPDNPGEILDKYASTRRSLLALAALAPITRTATADSTYPSKPIRLIIPFSPGGATDVAGRLVADGLAAVLKTTVVVENRDGAAGVIGLQAAANSPADGYTIAIAGNSLVTSHRTLYPKLPYDPPKDFLPIARLVAGSHILVVKPSSPFKTVQDLILAAKENPGQITYGSGGKGTSVHLAAELFQIQAGIKLLHVPYRGTSLALNGLLSNDTDLLFDTTPSASPRILSGQLRALGIASLTRDPNLPDVPTIAEQGLPGYEVLFWLGMYAPKNTPVHAQQALERAVHEVVTNPEFERKLKTLGMTSYFATGADLSEQIARETNEWRDVIQKAGVTME